MASTYQSDRAPPAKRRKLDIEESQSLPTSSTCLSSRFVDDGSHLWDRPCVPDVDEITDSISEDSCLMVLFCVYLGQVFQQIEIEEEKMLPLIRMYGVTLVSCV